jgi:hypothetical protein
MQLFKKQNELKIKNPLVASVNHLVRNGRFETNKRA